MPLNPLRTLPEAPQLRRSPAASSLVLVPRLSSALSQDGPPWNLRAHELMRFRGFFSARLKKKANHPYNEASNPSQRLPNHTRRRWVLVLVLFSRHRAQRDHELPSGSDNDIANSR